MRDPRAGGTTPFPIPGAGLDVEPGASVVMLRPRRLRGTIAIAKRRVTGGWEVEIRSADGVPLHLTVPARALRVRRP